MSFMSEVCRNTAGGPLDTLASSSLPSMAQGYQPECQLDSVNTTSTLHQDSPKNNPALTTVPPEIIQLIVNYLDKKELVTAVTLNWTWANLAAPKLWEEIMFTANNTRVVFLITKSVAPPPLVDSQRSLYSSLLHPSSDLPMITPDHPSPEALPPVIRRRNSYPWPTLLPYHSMVQKLNVSLSSADMIQDLIDIIPCCTELRQFSIHSAIPTEDLMIKGMIAGAVNDIDDPLNELQLRPSASAASLSSLASQSSQVSGTRRCRLSRSLNSKNTNANAAAGLQNEDDITFMAATASQSGIVLGLLANSCPKLEKVTFSGFHPISVLGAPTDLRPTPQRFDLKSYQDEGVIPIRDSTPRPPSFLSMTTAEPTMATCYSGAELPPLPPIPEANRTTPHCPPTPSNTHISSLTQSQIHSVQFVNCTLPPQYLLAMIQHSLPSLTEINLMQCWQGNPLQAGFLQSLAKICPSLKAISLHATQSHRGVITSEHILQLLRSLEGKDAKDERDKGFSGGSGYGGHSTTDFPLGMFGHSSYLTASSTSATHGFGSSNSSQSSSSSDTVPLPSGSATSSSSSFQTNGIDTWQQQQQVQHYPPQEGGGAGYPSDLESFKVTFTHSILDAAIVQELSDRSRHPKLTTVEFGSEDAFDVGMDLVQKLQSLRPEISALWIDYGDTGEDRED
ncbi:hypothetical protein MVEG_03038 [Podila verticillata NRRL 6337]|nr:hypothetical protein MVEG_03038 [Podila verticillata NRRL 6337]